MGVKTKKANKLKAVTLVELVVVIVVTGILTVGLAAYITQAVDTWDFLSTRSDIVNQARVGLLRMGRDIRNLTGTPYAADADYLEFDRITPTGSTLRMRYDHDDANDRVLYTVDENGNNDLSDETARVLIGGVKDPGGGTDFQFRYFDSSGTELSAPITLADIYRIRIEFVVSDTGMSANPKSIQLHYEIFPRNFKY
jgi:type II secretory pathway pseudopilin PulG